MSSKRKSHSDNIQVISTNDEKSINASINSRVVTPISMESNKQLVLSIGLNVDFLLSPDSLEFLYIDENTKVLLGCPSNELRYRTVYYIFDRFITRDHQNGVNDLFRKGLMLLLKHHDIKCIVNLEFNIVANQTKIKRILMQMRILQKTENSKENLIHGKLIDISELVKDGLPKLFSVSNNSIADILEENINILNSKPFGLSIKEIKVLEMKSKGMRVKEIAKIIKSTEFSIYSMFRDIKNKTNMEILTLIKTLFEKGIL